jgi:hypothetical protein
MVFKIFDVSPAKSHCLFLNNYALHTYNNIRMERTIELTGTSSELSAYFNHPLSKQTTYRSMKIGLLSIATYNSVPNIESGVNNAFHFTHNGASKSVLLPTGTYEIKDIEAALRVEMLKLNVKFFILSDKVLQKCVIKCGKINIDFTKKNTFRSLLGFKSAILKFSPDKDTTEHIADNLVNMNSINSINVDVDIAEGTYKNGVQSHSIYQFTPKVPTGYKIFLLPSNIIYYNVTRNVIDSIRVRFTDQRGQLVNFRKEVITVVLHLIEEHYGNRI